MKANVKARNIKDNRQAYARVIGSLVALLLMIIVGVMVFWETSSSITLNSPEANESKNKTTDMAKTVFGLLPIIALAVVASIIIGVIIGFGGMQKM